MPLEVLVVRLPCRFVCAAAIGWKGVHHVGLLVQDLDKSRQFYEGILGKEIMLKV